MDVFKNFTKVIKIRQVLLDNSVFQLHYRVTALLLLGCSALVASKQHFGDPIDCITRDDVPNKIMDTYCWIHSTFTLPRACNKTVGIEVAHPCVDKSSGEPEERVYHKYYQWVYFVLFFQAACFYAPHFFWKMYDGQLLCKLTAEFHNPILKSEHDEDGNERPSYSTMKQVARYLARNRTRHKSYFYYFILCELFNFVNVILQIYIVDAFLGGMFTTYGLDVLNYVQLEQDDRVDPMVRVFPKMTKCTFHRFGASGDVQKYDALCILPLNIINEKIYIVMWFWFVFLAFVTGLWLVYRLLTLFQSKVRYQVLRRRASLAKPHHIQYLLANMEPGEWFILSMMCKNMDSQWFRLLVANLTVRMRQLEDQKQEKSPPRGGGGINGRRVKPSDSKLRGTTATATAAARDDGKERMLDTSDPESGEHELTDVSSGEDDDDNINLEERSKNSKPLRDIAAAPRVADGPNNK